MRPHEIAEEHVLAFATPALFSARERPVFRIGLAVTPEPPAALAALVAAASGGVGPWVGVHAGAAEVGELALPSRVGASAVVCGGGEVVEGGRRGRGLQCGRGGAPAENGEDGTVVRGWTSFHFTALQRGQLIDLGGLEAFRSGKHL